jgi:hypothetical protein
MKVACPHAAHTADDAAATTTDSLPGSQLVHPDLPALAW